MINKIVLDKNQSSLYEALDRYIKIALNQGAHDAKIIRAESIVLDERVLMKCRFPLCSSYGACQNCPPNTVSVKEMRELVKLFEYAVVFKVNYPSEQIVKSDSADKTSKLVGNHLIISRIISKVESTAFYDGYYFATGFSSGPCKFLLCNNMPCQALQGMGCRFTVRAYATMEAVGMDVFRIATSLGWDIYPIGSSCEAEMIPHGTRLGLVLIA